TSNKALGEKRSINNAEVASVFKGTCLRPIAVDNKKKVIIIPARKIGGAIPVSTTYTHTARHMIMHRIIRPYRKKSIHLSTKLSKTNTKPTCKPDTLST